MSFGWWSNLRAAVVRIEKHLDVSYHSARFPNEIVAYQRNFGSNCDQSAGAQERADRAHDDDAFDQPVNTARLCVSDLVAASNSRTIFRRGRLHTHQEAADLAQGGAQLPATPSQARAPSHRRALRRPAFQESSRLVRMEAA